MTAKIKTSTRPSLSKAELERLREENYDAFLRLKLTDEEKIIIQEMVAEREKRRLEEVAKLREASKPLVSALHAAGYPVNGVWDLVNTTDRYDSALPILAEHLERDYPPEIQEGIARAMGVGEAMPWRPVFIRLIRSRPPMPPGKRDGFRDGLAVAIGNTTGPHNVEETLELLRDRSLGESRILMTSIFRKLKDPVVQQVLLDLREREPELRIAISELPWVKKLDKA
ncbi:hypothetical protein F8A86_11540 [Betaproteobacteria bacterium SCN1]|jgi:hypothetical protein|nr:hypothetical protein F8A86_11540 [Betaproteobacteria bacterium SCN1]